MKQIYPTDVVHAASRIAASRVPNFGSGQTYKTIMKEVLEQVEEALSDMGYKIYESEEK